MTASESNWRRSVSVVSDWEIHAQAQGLTLDSGKARAILQGLIATEIEWAQAEVRKSLREALSQVLFETEEE